MSDDERTRHYLRVNRGGSWYYTAAYTRIANRYRIAPGCRDNYLGFRLVISAEA